jgi:hypothetical protein
VYESSCNGCSRVSLDFLKNSDVRRKWKDIFMANEALLTCN